MRVIRYRLTAAILTALTVFTGKASDGVSVILRASVSESTCDVRLMQSHGAGFQPISTINLGYFTRADFRNNRVSLPGSEALVMMFPERSCAGRNLRVKVEGPAARGARGQGWGDTRRVLAWGMRLRWVENGVAGHHSLTPSSNTLSLTVPSGRQQEAGNSVHGVVFRPELRTWDYRRVVAGQELVVPLVFSVMYE